MLESPRSSQLSGPILTPGTAARLERSRQNSLTRKKILNSRALMVGASVLVLLALLGLFGPLFTQDPQFVDPVNRLEAPGALHLFGTDAFGRDVLSRIVSGAGVSLIIGTSVALITAFLGLAIGLYAAFFPWADALLMRICDGLMAFPAILLAISITAALGASTINVIISLVVVFTPIVARVVRASALSVNKQVYMDALRSQGAGPFRLLWVNALPNVLSPLIVQATFIFADSLIIEAALSFLGAGIPAPAPSWGNMLLEGKSLLFQAWWMTVFPGAAIMLTVLCANLLGDGLRDVLDPHQKTMKPIVGFVSRKRK